jgi:hypothetical protein
MPPMKRRVLLAGLILLPVLSSCVAVPPLITVNHQDSSEADLRARVDSLERRVRDLEAKSQHQ